MSKHLPTLALASLFFALGLFLSACESDEGGGYRQSSKKDSQGGSDTTTTDSVADPCVNGALDEGESDIDCGGPCAACAQGKNCFQDSDCLSAFCGAGYVCREASCGNGSQDPGETGVDCGGPCPACLGEACGSDTDCQTGYCKGGACDVPTCNDGIKNGSETGVDCGGDCSQCATGMGCLTDQNCVTGYCKDGYCAEPSCSDATKNQGESDVDCGGPCGGCALGEACVTGGDCDSGSCAGGVCATVAPACDDGQQNGGESDVDCGGGCAACGFGKACGGAGDCASGLCEQGLCAAPASCDDGAKNGGEADIDCGGPCKACATGKYCNEHEDCLSVTCVFGICKEPTCADDVQNQGEADVDCGGPCQACADGMICADPQDCQSLYCWQGTCVSCEDGEKNGSETDVDCGGGCPKCGLGDSCLSASDCSTGGCEGGLCCSPNACGACSSTPNEICDGVDNDCDGQTDESSQIGSAPSCDKQAGVCAGAKSACKGSQGWTCDSGVYASHNGQYEANESSCDGKDNDCDGQTDEGVQNACGFCGAVPQERCNGLDDDCDGQVDELPECGACVDPMALKIGQTDLNTAGAQIIAKAGDHIYIAYSEVYRLMLAEVKDGGVYDKTELEWNSVWNPNGGARPPQLRSTGDELQMAWRDSQLSYELIRLSADLDVLENHSWSCYSYLDPKIVVSAAGDNFMGVFYRDEEHNGSYYAGVSYVGVYNWNAGYMHKVKNTWYSPGSSSSAMEMLSLPSGEVLMIYTNYDKLEVRSSEDDFVDPIEISPHVPRTISAAVGPDGKGHVVGSFYGGYANSYNLNYATVSDSGDWSDFEPIGYGREGMITLSPDGAPVVASKDDDGLVLWQRDDGEWIRAASLGWEDGGDGAPGVATDSFGRYHVSLSRTGCSGDTCGLYYVMLCPDLAP